MIAIIIIIPIINNVLVTKRDSGNVVLLCFWYEPFCHRHYYCQHHQIITTIIIIPKINTVLVTEFDSGKAPTLQHQKASALHLNARGQRLDSNYEYLWLSASDYFMLWLSACDYHLILQVEHSGVRPTYQFKCLFNKFCCFQQCLLHEIKMYVIKIKAQWSTVEHGKTTNHRNSSGTMLNWFSFSMQYMIFVAWVEWLSLEKYNFLNEYPMDIIHPSECEGIPYICHFFYTGKFFGE